MDKLELKYSEDFINNLEKALKDDMPTIQEQDSSVMETLLPEELSIINNTYVSDAPKEEEGLWVIEMKDEGQWVKLGGKFGAKLADERIDQFMQHFLYRPPGSQNQECKRQFRRVKIG